MKSSTEKALDRAMKAMTRPARPKRSRFSTSPIVLAIGLVIGHQLTYRLVPTYWAAMLPGGLEQAGFFRGWAGLLWSMAVACHRDFAGVVAILAGIWFTGFFLSTFLRPLRPLVWLMVLAVIAIDGGIVYVMARTAIEATAQSAGIPLPGELTP